MAELFVSKHIECVSVEKRRKNLSSTTKQSTPRRINDEYAFIYCRCRTFETARDYQLAKAKIV